MDYNERIKNYETKEIIGKGTYGKVFKAFDKINKRECALKIIDKNIINDSNGKDYLLNSIKNEILLHQLCKSKNVVELYDSFETKNSIVIATELCECNLAQYIKKFTDKNMIPFYLDFIQKFFKDLNNAIKILYKNHIMHRDIAPDNIFLKTENGNIIPKLGDFGIATLYKDEKDEKYEQVGKFVYMAPEIIKGDNYNYKCDLYSLGCILYFMVFLKDYYYDLMEENDKIENLLSKQKGLKNLYDLLKGLLEKDKEKRISMEEYLNHPFFKENSENLKDVHPLFEPIIDEEKKELKELIKCSKKIVNIMGISQSIIENKNKTANILYYDENIVKHLDEIHQDAILFERNTSGTFIL